MDLSNFDFGALLSKVGGNKAADVFPKANVGRALSGADNPNTQSNFIQTVGDKIISDQTAINTANTRDTNNTNLTSGTGTGRVGPTAAQTDPLLASLASLDQILTNKNAGTADDYRKAIDGYDDADARDKANYDQNTQQNEQSYTSNNQAALLNAANASTGLRGVLASLGSLGGSGSDIVQRLVGLAANSDTGASRQNFEANATRLNQSWQTAEQEGRQRRDDAEAFRDNELQNNKSNVLTSRQTLYQQLADMFGAGSSEGNSYASKAGALAAPIADTTRESVAPYAKGSNLFTPAALNSYLAGTQNLNVDAGGGENTPINSPIYGSDKKKDTLAGVA